MKEENPHCSMFQEASATKHIHVVSFGSSITPMRQEKLP